MKPIICSALFVFSAYLLVQCADSESPKNHNLETKETLNQVKSNPKEKEKKSIK